MTDWYKDAIVFEVHVRAFRDTSGDGTGDFVGLTSRLDYIEALGVNTIWLLPFFPSPLRDDGYDVADYEGVHPDYGTLADFRAFLDAAHNRGLRVITELVVNHTYDQHPWFQRARRSLEGSPERNFYVWSDTPDRFPNVRVIFTNTETSNWTWDEEAGAYFWHRFFSHQPDLNFDSPHVREAILRVMRFWLDMGVDGLRLDAVPYLFEREGTNGENLPETHDYLKELRRQLDSSYTDRIFIAEANQWPRDAVAYFGDGDECHMAFHFPLMPRLFMALAKEDRSPIIEILDQTPDIPRGSQWAVFLRNHDELTLEMVSDEERAFMLEAYAAEPRARVNLGIRRRLAPLLENDRRRIELTNGLLLSFPGTPVIYYGDEIGMGDNIDLDDRDSVRTPMQWSDGPNAGFSNAAAADLYLPVVTDPQYAPSVVNVAAQESDTASLLWWMRRLISARRDHPVFGRGTMQILYPDDPAIFAFVVNDGAETVLVVANLGAEPQSIRLDLTTHAGSSTVDLISNRQAGPISADPFAVDLGPYEFTWLAILP